jgi:predicted RNase H-related nuclease YkuK (DUF458 family)
MEEKKLIFKKITGEVVEDVEKYVKDWSKNNPHGKVIIACDSQVHGRRIKYSVVIVMHYIDRMGMGKGGHVIVADVWEKRMIASQLEGMPSKLWREAEYALLAAQIVDGDDEMFKKRITIHLDINSDPKGDSNIMYASSIGLLTGYGYYALGKPFAKIASNVADHFCR